MKIPKLLQTIVLLALTGFVRAQAPPGPANLAGTLYASNFAQWTVSQGTNGQWAWSSPSACTAKSGGVQFPAFTVGTPVQIVDNVPANSEVVVPTQVQVGGSGCSITIAPIHPHNSFFFRSATAGLQEAINYANAQGPPFMIYVTPDFTRLGGQTQTIDNALGNVNITIQDARTSVIVPYLWQGMPAAYTAVPFGGGGGPGTPAGPQNAWQYNAGGGNFGGSSALLTDSTHQALLINATNPANGNPFSLNGTFTGTQQNPILMNLSINDSQPGWNQGTGPNSINPLWSIGKGLILQCNFFTQGINHCSDEILQTFSVGDAGWLRYQFSDGGCWDGSCEGIEQLGMKGGQNSSFLVGNAGTGASIGTTSLPVVNISRPPSVGAYMLDLASSVTGSLTGASVQIASTGLFGLTTSASTSVSRYGTLACGNSIGKSGTLTNGSNIIGGLPGTGGIFVLSTVSGTGIPGGTIVQAIVNGTTIQVSNNATTSGVQSLGFTFTGLPDFHGVVTNTTSIGITCTATNAETSSLGSGLVAQTTPGTGIARIAATYPENVVITSVGTLSGSSQTVAFNYQHPHGNAAAGLTTTIWQAGTHGYLSMDSFNALDQHFKTTYVIFGTTISGTLACGVGANGGVIQCPNDWNKFAPIAITSLVKSGTTLTAQGGASYLNLQPNATIAACSDSLLNGAVTNVRTVNGGLTMTQTAGGTSCPSATIIVPLLTSFHIYNGAIVTAPQIGDSIPLEANDVNWTSGDPIENPLYDAQQIEGDWVTQQVYTSTDLLFRTGLQRWWQGAGISGSFLPVNLVNLNPCSFYIGCGGSKSLLPTITVQQVHNGILQYFETPVSGAPVIQGGCHNQAEGGCANTAPQILWSYQGGFVGFTTVSWAIVSNNLTVTFTPIGGISLDPLGNQHFTLSGCTTTYLNTKYLSTSSTSNTITGPLPASHSDASGTETCSMAINGLIFEGDNISINPDTREFRVPALHVFGDAALDGNLSLGTIVLGNTNADGTVAFTFDGVNQLGNIKIASRFAPNYICVDSLNHNCIIGGNVQPNPDGTLGTGTLHVDGTAQINLMQAQLDYPLFLGNPTYTGSLGTHNINYFIAVDTAEGFKGMPSPTDCCSSLHLVQYPMGGGNSASIPLPAASSGYPAGTVPHIYADDETSLIIYDLGTGTWGATFVDNSAGSVLASIQLNGLNGISQAAHYVSAPGGYLRAYCGILTLATCSGISFPAGTGEVSVDTTTALDGLGQLDVAKIKGPGSSFAIGSGTASNTDGVGELTMSGGTAVYNFSNTWTSVPACWIHDQTTPTNDHTNTLTVSTTQLIVNAGTSDVVQYGCQFRN